jgi:AcrR family transcriptional regulator
MAIKHPERAPLHPRKTPLQSRSIDTVAVILEAAARILELRGFEGFNTNAVAERAGVSIGSLYQYFPNKDSLLSKLLERETAPLLAVSDELAAAVSCRVALRAYIRACVRHQLSRPKLARLLDQAETRELFQRQSFGTVARLLPALSQVLTLPDAPPLAAPSVAAADLIGMVRSLVDAAGEREHTDANDLVRRAEGAVWGYLHAAAGSTQKTEHASENRFGAPRRPSTRRPRGSA